jgi:eukaryotic-like serine/threonine-protein kinase
MGEVYRATDTVLERKVAVKLLSQRYATEDEVRTRFRREALAAARLSGAPHVITVFDVGEHRKRPFIVMEYLEGGSVHDRLREGPVAPGEALEWLAQAGQALDRAHAEGVVHRDVKPANLLIDRGGDICVTDFGIASTTGVDTLTLPGTVLGTAGYLSPEQARGEAATAASDRYGLGVVAFELLTGRRPYEADTSATEAFAHVNAPVPSAERLHPDLPPGVDTVFSRALAKEPERRPATCAELVSDLRSAFRSDAVGATLPLASAPTRVLPATRAPSGRQQRRRPRASLLLGALALAVAGLVAALLIGTVRDAGGSEGAASRPSRTVTTTTTTTTQTQTTASFDATALNDAGFALMQAGDFSAARPLLEQAVRALRGTGSITEAYASYNLAFTRLALGVCSGVLPLLERSEAVQGHRREIDDLRAEASDRCAPADSSGRGNENDDGNGRGKGKGKDD